MVNKLLDEYECPFDIYMFKFINMHLDMYYKLGFTPNMVTTLSIIFGLLAAYEIIYGNFIFAAFLVLVSYYLDCVDGKLARKYNMVSQLGDYYDHFGDLFKYILIIYALIKSNKKTKINERQWFFILILIILTVAQAIHMGYQESLYNNKSESSYLNILRKIVSFDKTPEKTIQYTKHMGCGSWNVCFAILIIFWRN